MLCPMALCHAPSRHMLPQFSQCISLNSFRAAQGGRPDLQGPLVAELKDQPAAGAPPCWDTGPHFPTAACDWQELQLHGWHFTGATLQIAPAASELLTMFPRALGPEVCRHQPWTELPPHPS